MRKNQQQHVSKPNLFFISGWGDSVKSPSYASLQRVAKAHYKVIFIHYKSKKGEKISKNTALARKQIENIRTSNDVIVGFSIGAVIAYQLATSMRFKTTIIASMTALLGKDIDEYPSRAVNALFTKDEVEEFKTMRYRKPLCKFIICYGNDERSELRNRSNKLHRRYGGKLISIKGATHRLNKPYREAILHELATIQASPGK